MSPYSSSAFGRFISIIHPIRLVHIHPFVNRYPFNISKSHLQAVGSPHAWPSLLAGLVWIVELLQASLSQKMLRVSSYA